MTFHKGANAFGVCKIVEMDALGKLDDSIVREIGDDAFSKVLMGGP